MNSKLQLALDVTSLEESLALLTELADLIDIVEVGTPFIIKDGLNPVRVIREKFPKVKILADVKIADGAKIESTYAFDAGADIITVLAFSEDQTILDTVEVARKYGKEVLVDMLAIKDIAGRSKQLKNMGVDYISVHNAFDLRDKKINPLLDLMILQDNVDNIKTAVAGGVGLDNLAGIAKAKPDIIIIGGAITNAQNKRETVMKMKEVIKNNQ